MSTSESNAQASGSTVPEREGAAEDNMVLDESMEGGTNTDERPDVIEGKMMCSEEGRCGRRARGRWEGRKTQGKKRAVAAADELADDAKVLTLEAEKAFLGFAIIDLLDKETYALTFGQYNARPVSSAEVTKLAKSMEEIGIQRYMDNNALPILMRRGQLDLATEEEPLPVRINAMGGQHRREAVQRLADAALKSATALEKKLQPKKSSKESSKESTLSAEAKATLTEALAEQTQKAEAMGYWLVAVYDADLVSENVGEFLSRNERRHAYKETPEELVVKVMKRLIIAKQEGRFEAELKLVLEDKTFTSIHNHIMKSRPMIHLVITLLELGPHFRNMNKFNTNFFSSQLANVHGGLMSRWLVSEKQRFQSLGALDPFPGPAESMKTAVEKYRDNDLVERFPLAVLTDKERTEAVALEHPGRRALREQLAHPTSPSLKRWQAHGLLDDIDECFLEHISNPLLMGSANVTAALEIVNYRTAVIKVLQKTFHKSSKEPEGSTERDAFEAFLGRVAFSLTKRADEKYAPLPLLTKSVFVAMHENLCMVDRAVMEVARWFEPLVDYARPPNHKNFDFHDYSAGIITHIQRSPKVDDAAADQVLDCILYHRADLLASLEIQCAAVEKLEILQRKIAKADLDAAFEDAAVMSFQEKTGLGNAVPSAARAANSLVNYMHRIIVGQGSTKRKGARKVAPKPKKGKAKAAPAEDEDEDEDDNVGFFSSEVADKQTTGFAVIEATQIRWADTPAKSAKRDLKLVAREAVQEHVVVCDYRSALMCEPVVQLRQKLHTIMWSHGIPVPMADESGIVDTRPDVDWWDDLCRRRDDRETVQHIVSMIEKSGVARAQPSVLSEEDTVAEIVHNVVKHLAVVSTRRQCNATARPHRAGQPAAVFHLDEVEAVNRYHHQPAKADPATTGTFPWYSSMRGDGDDDEDEDEDAEASAEDANKTPQQRKVGPPVHARREKQAARQSKPEGEAKGAAAKGSRAPQAKGSTAKGKAKVSGPSTSEATGESRGPQHWADGLDLSSSVSAPPRAPSRKQSGKKQPATPTPTRKTRSMDKWEKVAMSTPSASSVRSASQSGASRSSKQRTPPLEEDQRPPKKARK
ncbi:hypothetical protein B0H21DRAFT_712744 [Amylocystis lapponica]|nr:hypothetical protein B0H21DRAFT_712744 [Amylocystis lapponica]